MASRPKATSLWEELKNTALGMVDLSPSRGTSCGLAARTSATVEFDVPKSSPQLQMPVRPWSESSCVFSISKLVSRPSDRRRRIFWTVYIAVTREVTLRDAQPIARRGERRSRDPRCAAFPVRTIIPSTLGSRPDAERCARDPAGAADIVELRRNRGGARRQAGSQPAGSQQDRPQQA